MWKAMACALFIAALPAAAEIDDQMRGALDGACHRIANDNPGTDCAGVADTVKDMMGKKGTPAKPEWVAYCAKSCAKLRGTSAAAAVGAVDEQMRGALDAACERVANDNASTICVGISNMVQVELAKKGVKSQDAWLDYCTKVCRKKRGISAASSVDNDMRIPLTNACAKVAKDNAGTSCAGVAELMQKQLLKSNVTSKEEWLDYCVDACKKSR